jgi:LEA14-like dessication related protein
MLRAFPALVQVGAAACLLLMVGCAGLGKTLEAPRVSLADVRLQEIKGLENIVQIDLRVFNSNDIPLTVRAIDCELTMNGKRLATGISRVEQEIPAYGTAVIPVTLYSSVADLLRGVMGLQNKEKVKFGLTGKLRVEGGAWMPSAIPFNAESELSLDGLNKSR